MTAKDQSREVKMSKEMYRVTFEIERLVDPSCLGQVINDGLKFGNVKKVYSEKYDDNSPIFGAQLPEELLKKCGWIQAGPPAPK